jgi:hypothetical protein
LVQQMRVFSAYSGDDVVAAGHVLSAQDAADRVALWDLPSWTYEQFKTLAHTTFVADDASSCTNCQYWATHTHCIHTLMRDPPPLPQPGRPRTAINTPGRPGRKHNHFHTRGRQPLYVPLARLASTVPAAAPPLASTRTPVMIGCFFLFFMNVPLFTCNACHSSRRGCLASTTTRARFAYTMQQCRRLECCANTSATT